MGIKIANTSGVAELATQNIKKNNERTNVSFGEKLERVSEIKHQDTLVELTKDIFKQGELLLQKCDIKEFKRYKELLTQFFNEVVSSGYQFGKEQKFDARGRNKLYANIKKVNTDMDKLAAELMKTQQNQVAILTMVDDIRGIIIDVMA